jgi:transposase InsO family protein
VSYSACGSAGCATWSPEPIRRYERAQPGELIHIDIKKLGRFDRAGHRVTGRGQGASRGSGWEFVHVCIDDASRIAFSRILPDEKKESATAFLRQAVAYYASLGITVTRVMTDNGSAYRSRDFKAACRDLSLKHIRTAELQLWMHRYNWHRPHGGISWEKSLPDACRG